ALLGRRSAGHRLLLVGGTDRELAPLVEEIKALGIGDVVRRLRAVSDEDLAWLYCAADALVMPSRSEGFGLPVLEAMASGTPVVSARTDALAEVAGDAAEYCAPSDAEALAAALATLLSSPVLRSNLAAKGLARAALFPREAFVRAHIEIYERLLSD